MDPESGSATLAGTFFKDYRTILFQEQTLKYVFSPKIGDLVRGLNGYLSADSPQLRVLNVCQRKLLRDIFHLNTKYSQSEA
jgi:hypothetical protein